MLSSASSIQCSQKSTLCQPKKEKQRILKSTRDLESGDVAIPLVH